MKSRFLVSLLLLVSVSMGAAYGPPLWTQISTAPKTEKWLPIKDREWTLYHYRVNRWGRSKGKRQGPYWGDDPGGWRSVSGHYADGKRSGVQVWWHMNGFKRNECTWLEGRREGVMTYWRDNGTVAAQDVYDRGVLIEKRNDPPWLDGITDQHVRR